MFGRECPRVDLEFDNVDAARFAINAVAHMRGDALAPIILQSIATALILQENYQSIKRARTALLSEDVKAAIDWMSNKEDAMRQAKNKAGLDG